jgi:hypothetical protein
MKQDWKVVSRRRRDALFAAEPFRRVANLRKFLAAAFFVGSRTATPRSRLCRKENLRNLLCRQFAARLVGAVDVRPGRFRRRGLSASLGFEFCVDRCGSRAARRRACGISACQDAGIPRVTCAACRHAAQALQTASFFGLPARCADANCLTLAATRLKFAARLVD